MHLTKKISGVLQKQMNAVERKNIWSTQDIEKYNWKKNIWCTPDHASGVDILTWMSESILQIP